MKRIPLLVTLLGLCFHVQSYSQNITQPAVNWQQFIPNIMGGNCVEISNVSYSGADVAYSFYKTDGEMGLTRGILMTTGNASFANGPNNQADATAENASVTLPPQSIMQHLGASGGMVSFHNTAFIRFNFRVRDSLDVYIRYVFASEEYNEFVNTQFNDVFGFYVEGPGIPNGIENIAKVPNTNLPVNINNLNNGYNTGQSNGPCMNCSYFVDNTGGTYTQFDGYTTPLTAYFSPIADSLYTITILVSDVGDGLYDSGVFLDMSVGTTNFTGSVTNNGQPLGAGNVYAYGYNIDSLEAPLEYLTSLNPNGTYTFNNLIYGAYLIRYIPDATLYPGLTPTYLDSAKLWNDARIVSIPCNLELGEVVAKKLMPSIPAGGYISGEVGVGEINNPKMKQYGKSNVVVILADKTTNEPVAWTLTDVNGKYEFKNVSQGAFVLYPEVPFVKNINAPTVNNAGNDSLLKQNFSVNESIAFHFAGDWNVNVDENILSSQNSIIYPNPSDGNFDVFIKNKLPNLDGTITVKIYDFKQVKKVLKIAHTMQNPLKYFSVSITDLSAGVYTMEISSYEKVEYVKFVIVK